MLRGEISTNVMLLYHTLEMFYDLKASCGIQAACGFLILLSTFGQPQVESTNIKK